MSPVSADGPPETNDPDGFTTISTPGFSRDSLLRHHPPHDLLDRLPEPALAPGPVLLRHDVLERAHRHAVAWTRVPSGSLTRSLVQSGCWTVKATQ